MKKEINWAFASANLHTVSTSPEGPAPKRHDFPLIRLVTKTVLKYLKDSNNDPGDSPHGDAGAKLDIEPARYKVCSQWRS